MARQFTRGRGRAGSKRMTSWLTIDGFGATVSNSAVLVASLTTLEKAKRPFTIVRTRMEVFHSSDQTVANESQVAAIGLCVVSEQAEAIGITAVPTPETDAASDLWFVHQWILNEYTIVSGVAIDANAGQRYSIDSKAMRKVNEDEDVVVVVEGATLFGGGSNILFAGRMLIKEH